MASIPERLIRQGIINLLQNNATTETWTLFLVSVCLGVLPYVSVTSQFMLIIMTLILVLFNLYVRKVKSEVHRLDQLSSDNFRRLTGSMVQLSKQVNGLTKSLDQRLKKLETRASVVISNDTDRIQRENYVTTQDKNESRDNCKL